MEKSFDARSFGKWGENVASWYLVKKGYLIVKRHFTSRFGEIDIIAEEKGQIVFVEVKTRSSYLQGTPEQGFTLSKSKKMERAIFAYISQNNIENFRIDVVAIICGLNVDKIIIRHHKAVSDCF